MSIRIEIDGLAMNCPKCGFQQDEGPERLRCGVIFARLHAAPPPQILSDPGHSAGRAAMGYFRRFYRVFRWVSLTVLITAIVLVLRSSTPPRIAVPPDSAQQAEEKILRFQSAVRHGAEDRLELDQPELNGWLGANLALNRPENPPSIAPQAQGSLVSLAQTATGGRKLDEASMQQARSSVRDVKIELHEDTLLLYAIFDLHGMDLSLELEGRLFAEDGYLRLEPTGGKLGSLPLMAGTLRAVADRLFSSPENRENFKLPPYIRDVGIEDGNLVVISQ